MKKFLAGACLSALPMIAAAQCSVSTVPYIQSLDTNNFHSCYIDAVAANSNYYSTGTGYNSPGAGYQQFPVVIPMNISGNNLLQVYGFTNPSMTYTVITWIDIDGDSAYEPGECFTTSSYSGDWADVNISIPLTAVHDTVSMRIIKVADPAFTFDCNTPCIVDSTLLGETEDYRVSISCAYTGFLNYDPAPNVCSGNSAEVQAYASNGYVEWTNDTNAAVLYTGDYFQFTTTGTDTVFYVRATDFPCSSPWYAVNVTILPSPVITLSATDTIYSCSSVTLDAGPGYPYYNWSTGDQNETATISTDFSGYVAVDVQDPNTGCYGEGLVWVNNAANAPGSYASTLVYNACGNGTIYLNYDSVISPGTCNWFQVPGMTYLGSGNISYFASDTGTYTFAACVNSACGIDTALYTVSIAPAPSVDSIYFTNAAGVNQGYHTFCYGGDDVLIATGGLTGQVSNWIAGETMYGMTLNLGSADTLAISSSLVIPNDTVWIVADIVNASGCHAYSDTLWGIPANTVTVNYADSVFFCSLPHSVGVTVDYSIFDIVWNTGDTTGMINITTPGNYSIDIYDHQTGCSDHDSFYAGQDYHDFDVLPDTSVICQPNGYFAIYNPDYSAQDWQEYDQFFSNQLGGYSAPDYIATGYPDTWVIVMVSDNYGCQGVDTTFLDYSGNFTIDLGPNITTANPSYTIGVPAYYQNYDWQPTLESTSSITVTTTGTYTLIVQNGNGCTATDAVTVTFNTGVEENAADNSISIFPNPAADKFTITATAGELISVRIYDASGKLVETKPANGNTQQSIDVSSLAAGYYEVEVLTTQGVAHRKIIVQR